MKEIGVLIYASKKALVKLNMHGISTVFTHCIYISNFKTKRDFLDLQCKLILDLHYFS